MDWRLGSQHFVRTSQCGQLDEWQSGAAEGGRAGVGTLKNGLEVRAAPLFCSIGDDLGDT